MPLPKDSTNGRPRRMRWLMIALAFLATVINYLDRQALSVAAPVLRQELHFGDIEYSRMVSAFMLAYIRLSSRFRKPPILEFPK